MYGEVDGRRQGEMCFKFFLQMLMTEVKKRSKRELG